jgi:hypothetical protein
MCRSGFLVCFYAMIPDIGKREKGEKSLLFAQKPCPILKNFV